ncbi:MAG: hypothetical protein DA407_03635 [Bacteroidetes bacterium]|nr:MAG: hypothetical protein DA407_03635 [Bacteroidota bacterium]
MPIKLKYSNRELKKETNDSTYVSSELSYQDNDGTWKSLNLDLRARGNFRRNNCYFVPIKISIEKKDYKDTKFDGHKKLKLVVPCLLEKDRNDNVLKEYIAYKLYEIISPYHFNTRRVDIELTEPRGKKEKIHLLKGFLIEDDKKIAKLFDGKIVDRSIHPLAQEELNSIRCEFFQFMIGNTDFSNLEQHNAKLIYSNNEIFPVPYDFDMSGLVNASYSTVSETLSSKSNISSVTQRVYRGFKRNSTLIEQVRQEYIQNKVKILEIIESLESQFENENEYEGAKKYIEDFFYILINENEFKTEILDNLRS